MERGISGKRGEYSRSFFFFSFSLFFFSLPPPTLQPDAASELRRPAELGHRTGPVRTVSASPSYLWQRRGVNRRRVAIRSPGRFVCVEPEPPPPATTWPDIGLGWKTLTCTTIPQEELNRFATGKENFTFEILRF